MAPQIPSPPHLLASAGLGVWLCTWLLKKHVFKPDANNLDRQNSRQNSRQDSRQNSRQSSRQDSRRSHSAADAVLDASSHGGSETEAMAAAAAAGAVVAGEGVQEQFTEEQETAILQLHEVYLRLEEEAEVKLRLDAELARVKEELDVEREALEQLLQEEEEVRQELEEGKQQHQEIMAERKAEIQQLLQLLSSSRPDENAQFSNLLLSKVSSLSPTSSPCSTPRLVSPSREAATSHFADMRSSISSIENVPDPILETEDEDVEREEEEQVDRVACEECECEGGREGQVDEGGKEEVVDDGYEDEDEEAYMRRRIVRRVESAMESIAEADEEEDMEDPEEDGVHDDMCEEEDVAIFEDDENEEDVQLCVMPAFEEEVQAHTSEEEVQVPVSEEDVQTPVLNTATHRTISSIETGNAIDSITLCSRGNGGDDVDEGKGEFWPQHMTPATAHDLKHMIGERGEAQECSTPTSIGEPIQEESPIPFKPPTPEQQPSAPPALQSWDSSSSLPDFAHETTTRQSLEKDVHEGRCSSAERGGVNVEVLHSCMPSFGACSCCADDMQVMKSSSSELDFGLPLVQHPATAIPMMIQLPTIQSINVTSSPTPPMQPETPPLGCEPRMPQLPYSSTSYPEPSIPTLQEHSMLKLLIGQRGFHLSAEKGTVSFLTAESVVFTVCGIDRPDEMGPDTPVDRILTLLDNVKRHLHMMEWRNKRQCRELGLVQEREMEMRSEREQVEAELELLLQELADEQALHEKIEDSAAAEVARLTANVEKAFKGSRRSSNSDLLADLDSTYQTL